jgi:subtilisin family serine protease
MLFLALALAFLYIDFNGDGLAQSTFAEEIKEVSANDDYSSVTITKKEIADSAISDVVKKYNLASDEAQTLTEDDPAQTFYDLGYTVFDEDDSYLLYTKFCLKRLIVGGEYIQTYGASRVIDGVYYDVLCYDTEEETSLAYANLSAQSDLEVIIDSVVKVSSTTEENSSETTKTYDYSGYNSWGAQAMEIGAYREYLQTVGTSEDVVVAVLDTGINTGHELFDGRLLTDSNGNIVGDMTYIKSTYTYSGYTFEDDHGHGSHVAGIICDLTPDNVKILPIKVLASDGGGTVSAVFAGFDDVLKYAETYNIACVNLSLSSGYNSSDYSEYNTYLTALREKNMLTVVAAGNYSEDTSNLLPAACDGAIVVSAAGRTTNSDGSYSYYFDSNYSDYGEDIDFIAPGTDIVSAYKSSTDAQSSPYEVLSGTSMAAPHVSAAIALLCSDSYYWKDGKPTYTATEIEQDLKDYAVSIVSGSNAKLYQGNGLVSLAAFVRKSSMLVTFTLYDQSSFYGDLISFDTTAYSVRAGSALDIDSVKISLKTSADEKVTGDYQITAEVLENPNNYDINIVKATYTVKPRVVTIKILDQSCFYGDTLVLDNDKYEITEGNLVYGDDLQLVLATPINSGLTDSAYIYAVDCNENYTVYYYEGIFTVQPRPVTIQLLAQSGVYGDSVALDNTAYEITEGNLVNGDDLGVVLSTTAKQGDAVGAYPISVAQSNLNSNYSVTISSANYEITKREVNVTVLNQTMVYGDSFAFDGTLYDYNKSDIVEGDDLGITLYTSATKNSDAGVYAIEHSHTNSNYAVEYTSGDFIIEPRKITVKLLDQTLVYGAGVTLSQTKYIITDGAFDGIKLNGLIIKTAESNYELDQTYEIIGELANNNYKVTFIAGKLTVISAEEMTEESGNVNDTPVEEQPEEGGEQEETPVEETPVEETPVEETPDDSGEQNNTPVEEQPNEEQPNEEQQEEKQPNEQFGGEQYEDDEQYDEELADNAPSTANEMPASQNGNNSSHSVSNNTNNQSKYNIVYMLLAFVPLALLLIILFAIITKNKTE